jgi:hypothetical protein
MARRKQAAKVRTRRSRKKTGDPKPQGEHHPDAPEHGTTEDDPWKIDGLPELPEECNCEPPRPPPPSSVPPERVKPKGDDCCQQILELLKCIPNIDQNCLKLHKPKATPKFKIANLCGEFPVKDRLAPMLLLILRRFRDSVPPGNAFEATLQGFLAGLPAKQLAALKAAQDGYEALPAARRDCVFDTRFAAWPDDKPLNPDFFARNLVVEILAFERYWRFGPTAGPLPAAGRARPWEMTFAVPGEPGKTAKMIAPWPWICAISPVAQKAVDMETDWFRNESQHVPGNLPRGSVPYFTHEFSWQCGPVSPGGSVPCKIEEPMGPGGGGFSFGECSGGADYRVFDKAVAKQVCLVVPQIDLGSEVGLRGLNFFSPKAKVHIRKVDGPPFRAIPPISLSDWQPDNKAAPMAAATCGEVRDHAYFIMPATVRDGPSDIPIPPGRYALTLVVPNDVNFAIAGGGAPPTEFASNELLFDLQPNPKQRYQILTDEAFCDEETDGPGSDEPWFTAVSATLEMPKADTTVQFPSPPQANVISIMTAEDVDTGEAITFPPATLFQDTLSRKVVAIGILGLEVDAEDRAREQFDDFTKAWGAYWLKWYSMLAYGPATGVLTVAIEKVVANHLPWAAMSPLGWVAAFVLVVVVVASLIYAAWAPADPIALDLLTYTERQLFDMTDANLNVVPEPTWQRIAQLHMTSESGKKTPVPGGYASTYSERRHYHSTHENSRYSLVYRFKRV